MSGLVQSLLAALADLWEMSAGSEVCLYALCFLNIKRPIHCQVKSDPCGIVIMTSNKITTELCLSLGRISFSSCLSQCFSLGCCLPAPFQRVGLDRWCGHCGGQDCRQELSCSYICVHLDGVSCTRMILVI